VATTTRSDDEILDIIKSMYEGTKVIYRIYKDDELILSLNTKKREHVSKSILEVNTGTIFKDLTEMKDVLLIDRKRALELVKRSFNYRYV
jgi:NMD protein affecting ribosome stability and mRNA decay